MSLVPLRGAPAEEPSGVTADQWRSLLEQAPRVDPTALRLALEAEQRARSAGLAGRSDVLALIDYSLPSTEPRLWVFDLERNRVLFKELVAHGKNSGQKYASRFSNAPGSRMSSLGTFITAGTYYGKHGYSLRLKGIDKGVNDNSLARAVVLHSAAYVSDAYIQRKGYLGQSWGCPAVRPVVARDLIDAIRGGAVLYAYYPAAGESAIAEGNAAGPITAESADE